MKNNEFYPKSDIKSLVKVNEKNYPNNMDYFEHFVTGQRLKDEIVELVNEYKKSQGECNGLGTNDAHLTFKENCTKLFERATYLISILREDKKNKHSRIELPLIYEVMLVKYAKSFLIQSNKEENEENLEKCEIY